MAPSTSSNAHKAPDGIAEWTPIEALHDPRGPRVPTVSQISPSSTPYDTFYLAEESRHPCPSTSQLPANADPSVAISSFHAIQRPSESFYQAANDPNSYLYWTLGVGPWGEEVNGADLYPQVAEPYQHSFQDPTDGQLESHLSSSFNQQSLAFQSESLPTTKRSETRGGNATLASQRKQKKRAQISQEQKRVAARSIEDKSRLKARAGNKFLDEILGTVPEDYLKSALDGLKDTVELITKEQEVEEEGRERGRGRGTLQNTNADRSFKAARLIQKLLRDLELSVPETSPKIDNQGSPMSVTSDLEPEAKIADHSEDLRSHALDTKESYQERISTDTFPEHLKRRNYMPESSKRKNKNKVNRMVANSK